MTDEQRAAQIGTLPTALRISDIFKVAEAQAEHAPELLVTYIDDMQHFKAYDGEITLVMCRELRKTVEISSGVALKLAMKFPERNVLILNTYAGADMLTSGFVKAVHLLNLKVPYTFQRYLPSATMDAFDDTVDLPSPENLRVLDCPTSTLTPLSLAGEIERNQADIVILNSLEFAAFTDRRRKELAEAILDIRHKRRISVLVFSHELRAMLPYSAGRGALGLLSAFSKSVWHLVEEWERRAWVSKLFTLLDHENGMDMPTMIRKMAKETVEEEDEYGDVKIGS
jgi:hypothetical protein